MQLSLVKIFKESDQAFVRYGTDKVLHEAGFDAYITGIHKTLPFI